MRARCVESALRDGAVPMLPKIKKWLSEANDWQRLWFGATVLWVLLGGFVYPLFTLIPQQEERIYFRQRVIGDFQNPACAAYSARPISELQDPGYRHECWYLFNYRSRSKSAKLPYTPDDYYAEDRSDFWIDPLAWWATMPAGALIQSGIVYLLGVVVAWILARVRKKKAKAE